MKNINNGKKYSVRKKKIFRFLLSAVLFIVLLFASMLEYLTLTEFKPAPSDRLAVDHGNWELLNKGETLKVLTWNCGYGALGDNADFFMDGGSGVMTADEDRVERNLSGIEKEIERADPDILMLQEIDEDSKRSHNIDQVERLRSRLEGYTSAFAYNYKVDFVPFPVPPLGRVNSGIITFSDYPMQNCERLQLPCPFSWPVRTANLKRSLLVTRIPVEGSAAELVLVNLHLEAYDSGEGKIAQTKMLAEFLNKEHEKGNFVIAGGDFNQIFSSENKNAYPLKDGTWHPGVIDITGILGAWPFLMEEKVPSCRSLDRPLAGADTDDFQYYLIDGFIVSGNIRINEFRNEDLGFVCSDHNPVLLKATLK